MINPQDNTQAVIETYSRLGYGTETRPLLPVKIERLKFAKGFKPAWKNLRGELDKHLKRRKASDRNLINRTLRLIVGNFVFAYFERKPLSIPNRGELYVPGTRLAKIFITRESTRAVLSALIEEGYIKLNQRGSKEAKRVNNYIATEKLAKVLVPLVYCAKEEYNDERYKEYLIIKKESKSERDRRIKKERKYKELGIEQLEIITMDIMETGSLPDDHPDLLALRKVNNFLKDVSYPLKAPVCLSYVRDPLHGGRLYTPAQNLPNRTSKIRLNMLLDGKEVVEIDLSASFFRIAAALSNIELPKDPYQLIADKARLNRGQVKFFFTRAFGNSNRGFRLIDKNEPQNSITKEDRILLENIVKKTYPEVFSYFYKQDPSANLFQSLEGIILLRTMARLAELKLPSIPIHDCLMVQREDCGVAETLLKRFWKEVLNVNFEPVTTVEKR